MRDETDQFFDRLIGGPMTLPMTMLELGTGPLRGDHSDWSARVVVTF